MAESMPAERGFWKRQFDNVPTMRQRLYDWNFGVVTPVICVLFDPIVFRSKMMPAFLGDYRLAAYSEIALGMLAISFSLLFRPKSASLSGLLYTGSIFSLLLGLFLIPFSIIGLLFGGTIGILGLVPLFSAFAFFRNALMTFPAVEDRKRVRNLRICALTGFTLLIVPIACQHLINQHVQAYMNSVVWGPESKAIEAGKQLEKWKYLANFDFLAYRWQYVEDEKRAALVRSIFHDLTGQDPATMAD